MFEIAFAYRFPFFDGSIHDRLRKERLIAFVVSEPAVAPHIDNDITPEGPAEIHRQLNDLGDRFGIFAVDVEDRDLQHLGDVAGIDTRFRF